MSDCVEIRKEHFAAPFLEKLIFDLDVSFAERLQQTVSLNAYSRKLSENAHFVTAQYKGEYIGLVAFYINEIKEELFIPYVCVKSSYRKLGVANRLMDYVCKEADKLSFNISLEVRNDNYGAKNLYLKHGFLITDEAEVKSHMVRVANFDKSVMQNEILVSICTLVYNHEPYLRECFEGFVMQKTNFAFEVLVHDDASTDNSAAIIREYTARYPDIFKPIYQTENQYSKGKKIIATFQFPRAKGKYIAMCEGDDYWTDPLKLQKQVDFLESHPDYVMCSHRFKIFKQKENLVEDDWYSEVSDGVVYDLNSLIHGKWYFHPLTVMFRTDKLNVEEYSRYPLSMDAVLFYHLLKKGKGYMMPDEMAVYRIHAGGVWSGITCKKQIKTEFIARIGIYEVEQSFEAAFFLRNQFTKWIPRSWVFQEWKLLLRSFKIISKHFGIVPTFKLFLLKILFHYYLKY